VRISGFSYDSSSFNEVGSWAWGQQSPFVRNKCIFKNCNRLFRDWMRALTCNKRRMIEVRIFCILGLKYGRLVLNIVLNLQFTYCCNRLYVFVKRVLSL
jgi:hypothetical protein